MALVIGYQKFMRQNLYISNGSDNEFYLAQYKQ